MGNRSRVWKDYPDGEGGEHFRRHSSDEARVIGFRSITGGFSRSEDREFGSRLDGFDEKVIDSHTLLGWRRVLIKVSIRSGAGRDGVAHDGDAR